MVRNRAEGFQLGASLTPEEVSQYKYYIVADDLVGTTGMCEALPRGQAILRQSSPFREFFDAMLLPGVHYVQTEHRWGSQTPQSCVIMKWYNAWYNQRGRNRLLVNNVAYNVAFNVAFNVARTSRMLLRLSSFKILMSLVHILVHGTMCHYHYLAFECDDWIIYFMRLRSWMFSHLPSLAPSFRDAFPIIEWMKEHDVAMQSMVVMANKIAPLVCTWKARTLYWAIMLSKYTNVALVEGYKVTPPKTVCDGEPVERAEKNDGACYVEMAKCGNFCIKGKADDEWTWLDAENLREVKPLMGPE